jgi:hypothetical protein
MRQKYHTEELKVDEKYTEVPLAKSEKKKNLKRGIMSND